jgi:hypothetical protein
LKNKLATLDASLVFMQGIKWATLENLLITKKMELPL